MSEFSNIRPGVPARIDRPAATGRIETLLTRLHPGQRLNARVIEARAGEVLLRIGNTLLAARSRAPLLEGDRLRLQVEQGLPRPVLRILSESSPSPSPTQALLRHALARQLPTSELRPLLARLPAGFTGGTKALAHTIAALSQPESSAATLDARAIETAFSRSGLFLETRLAKGLPPDTEDRKLHLLRLRRALLPEQRPVLPPRSGTGENQNIAGKLDGDHLLNRLLASIESELGRIQQHQARALPGDDPNRQTWHFTLPLHDEAQRHPPHLKIEREYRHDENGKPGTDWRVEIHFDFGDLGAVSAHLSLQDGQLRCAFHSQRANTARRFAQALPQLDERLHAAGLQVVALTSLEEATQAPDSGLPDGLLDERA